MELKDVLAKVTDAYGRLASASERLDRARRELNELEEFVDNAFNLLEEIPEEPKEIEVEKDEEASDTE